MFRILTGAWFLIDYISMIVIGRVHEAYIDSTLNFPFYGLEFIKPLPGLWMYLIFALTALGGLGIMLGYRYRLSLGLFFSLHLYVFLIDIVYTLNKFYLFLILAFVLFFMEAHRFWSLDVKQGRVKELRTVPRWNILIFQVFYGLIYTYSGISKINPDWLFHGQPLRTFFGYRWLFSWMPEGLFNATVFGFTYCGMIFDLTITWLLTFHKTRKVGNLLQASFHSLNFFILGIGTLSIYMALTTWLLFPTPWLVKKLGLEKFEGEEEIPESTRKLTVVSLSIFLLVNLLLPHRHYLAESNVNLSEKGHRFSWRLMTRTKSGSASLFFVVDPKSKEQWAINPREYLTRRQYRKMSGETDLVLVFAHWLEEEWKKKGYEDVEVYGQINVRLNGRNVQYLVDPEQDLTKVSRSYVEDKVTMPLLPRE